MKKTTHKPRPRTAVTKVAGPAAGEAPAKKAAARKALR
nr:A346 [uncultured bacterium]